MIVSTTDGVVGYRVVRQIGVVCGVAVRSRSLLGDLLGNVQAVFGGQLSAYVRLADAARKEAFDLLCENAQAGGANAVIGMRYGSNDMMEGITEVLAYGTAVWLEPV